MPNIVMQGLLGADTPSDLYHNLSVLNLLRVYGSRFPDIFGDIFDKPYKDIYRAVPSGASEHKCSYYTYSIVRELIPQLLKPFEATVILHNQYVCYFKLVDFDFTRIRQAAAHKFQTTGEISFKYADPFVDSSLMCSGLENVSLDKVYNISVALPGQFDVFKKLINYNCKTIVSSLEFIEDQVKTCLELLQYWEDSNLSSMDIDVNNTEFKKSFILVRDFGKEHRLLRISGEEVGQCENNL